MVGVLLVAVGLVHWLPSPIVFDVPFLPNVEAARLGIPTELADRGAWAYSGYMLVAASGASPFVPLLNAGSAIGWLTAASIFGGTALATRRSAPPWLFLLTLAPLIAVGRFWDFVLTSKFSVAGLGLLCAALALIFTYLQRGDRRAALVGALLIGLGGPFGNSGLLYGGMALTILFVASGEPFILALGGVAAVSGLAFTAAPALGLPAVLLLAVALPLLVAIGGARFGRTMEPSRRLWKLHPGGLLLVVLGLGAAAALLLPTDLYSWYAPGSGLSLFTDGYGPLFFLAAGGAILAALLLPEREAYFPVVALAVPVATQSTMLVLARLLPRDLLFQGAPLSLILWEASRTTTLYVFPLATAIVLALALAALLAYCRRTRRPLAALALTLAVALGCWYAPFATDPQAGGNVAELVPVRPLTERLWWVNWRFERVQRITEQVGPAPGFDPQLFDYSPDEVRLARYLGDRYGRDTPCLLFLIPPSDQWKDVDAQGFFSWGYQNHLFPLSSTFSAPADIELPPDCDPSVLIIHRDAVQNPNPLADPHLANLGHPGPAQQIGPYLIQELSPPA